MYVFCAVGRDNADDALLEHLKRWVSENPPPAHVMLIAGDRGYARTLRQLRENKYNILLVTWDAPPSKVFSDIASILWKWSAILEKKPLGEETLRKTFERSPDGYVLDEGSSTAKKE